MRDGFPQTNCWTPVQTLRRALSCALIAAAMPALAEKDPAARLLEEQRQDARQAGFNHSPLSDFQISGRPALDANPADVAESGPTIANARIAVDDAGLPVGKPVSATVARFLGLPLGTNRLELLLRQLDARLVEAGFVTSRALLESASADTGEVRIRLQPGCLEGIRNGGDSGESAFARAFPIRRGDVIRLPDVEQGIHQINRLRLYQAQVTLRPGDSPGGSVLDLALGLGKPWRASLGVDNQGSSATGQNRLRAGFGFDDALGVLDAFQVQALASSHSRAALASLAVPRGYETWSLTASGSQSTQRLPGKLEVRSSAWTALTGWNRVLGLSAEGRDSVDLTMTRSRFGRRIEGTSLDADRLAVLRAAYSHVRRSPAAHWYVEPALSAGLPVFGARRDPDGLERGSVHGQFVKIGVNASVVTAIAHGAAESSLQVAGQASRVGLHGSEQLSLGGLSSIRGFREGAIAGDSGFIVRGEIRLPRAFGNLQGWGQAVPYAHLDYGTARFAQADRRNISSAGVGMRWSGYGAVLETVVSHPIAGPGALREGARVHFSLGMEI